MQRTPLQLSKLTRPFPDGSSIVQRKKKNKQKVKELPKMAVEKDEDRKDEGKKLNDLLFNKTVLFTSTYAGNTSGETVQEPGKTRQEIITLTSSDDNKGSSVLYESISSFLKVGL
jgi:uroporphyrinogen-III synthase